MFDRIWRYAADRAIPVAGILVVSGFILFGLATYLNLLSVQFSGLLKEGVVPATFDAAGQPEPMHITKQVGYFFAPNWLLTGLVLLPAAIYYLLRSRAALEPLICRLVERKMIVDEQGQAVGEDRVLEVWKRHSRWWSNIATVVFICCVAFTVIADFIPVVLVWNLVTPSELAGMLDAEQVALDHAQYEFDWSVASTFAGTRIPGWVNAAFAAIAYLVVPVFGSAVLFSAMTWFFSTHAVFSNRSLSREGLRLVPDAETTDPRCGFQVFEEFFSSLVRATFFTAVIVVAMHLQNVYLRSPIYSNIMEMVFGNKLQVTAAKLYGFDFGGVFAELTSLTLTFDALRTDVSRLSPQTFVAAVALAMLALIVFGMVWGWLRASAISGRDYMVGELEKRSTRDSKLKTRLKKMRIWPLGWADLNTLLAAIVIVAGSMIWTNFLVFAVALLILWATVHVLNVIRDRLWRLARPPSDADED